MGSFMTNNGVSQSSVNTIKQINDYEARVKMLWIRSELIVGLLLGMDQNEYISIPKWDIPQGCEIRNVFYAPERRSFGIIVYHPSFPLVEEGLEAPSLTATYHCARIKQIDDVTSTETNSIPPQPSF